MTPEEQLAQLEALPVQQPPEPGDPDYEWPSCPSGITQFKDRFSARMNQWARRKWATPRRLQILTVGCPYCHAAIGQICHYKNDLDQFCDNPHPDRVRIAPANEDPRWIEQNRRREESLARARAAVAARERRELVRIRQDFHLTPDELELAVVSGEALGWLPETHEGSGEVDAEQVAALGWLLALHGNFLAEIRYTRPGERR